jgi:hypothetical protein
VVDDREGPDEQGREDARDQVVGQEAAHRMLGTEREEIDRALEEVHRPALSKPPGPRGDIQGIRKSGTKSGPCIDIAAVGTRGIAASGVDGRQSRNGGGGGNGNVPPDSGGSAVAGAYPLIGRRRIDGGRVIVSDCCGRGARRRW